jgi:hypothetical protein
MEQTTRVATLPLTRWHLDTQSHATTVFAIFLVAQVLDGLLTLWGVLRLGVQVEANVLIATAIGAIGAHRAVLAAKLLACVCGYILYRTASHTSLAISAGICVGIAVVPWLIIVAETLARGY